MAARPRGILFSFVALAAFAGCEETETTAPEVVHPTLVEVSPDDFLSGVPCGVGPGSMQVYVATLFDHGPRQWDESESDGGSAGGAGGAGGEEPRPGEAIRRSGPVACTTAVGFAGVTPGNQYSIELEAFDRADVVVTDTDGDPDAGLPVVLDPATEEVVPARWTTSCGKNPLATARASAVRRIRNCSPLVDHQPSTVTLVELRPERALVDVGCGTGSGDVKRFEVTTPAGTTSLPCGEALTVEDVTAGRTLVLDVLAFRAGDSAAALGTTCTAVPTKGVTVEATCSPFTDKGALEIDPAAAAAALGASCDTLRELTITAPGAAPLRVLPSSCGTLVPLVGLERGEQTVGVVATPSDGSAALAGTCAATVVPGRRVLASCALSP